MRIAYLVPTSIYSGAENMTLLIAKQLSKCHDVWYCSPSGVICDYTKSADVPHFPIRNISVKTVKHIKKTITPDIFHACDNRASMVCALAGVTFVSHLHNNPPWLRTPNPYSLSMLFFCLRSKRTIGVSDSVCNEFFFSRYIRNKYITIPNAVDLSHVKMLADKQEVTHDLCFIGRMTLQKTPQTFVRIVKKITEHLPNISAVMIGDGELLPETKNLAAQLGLQEHITFTGFLKNPYSLLQNTRLLIMPSLYEGFGLIAIEAMSLGKPVIASKVGGLINIVDVDCGGFCANEDDFAEAAIKLLTDDKLYSKKSSMAEEKALIFGDIVKYVTTIEALYKEAIEI